MEKIYPAVVEYQETLEKHRDEFAEYVRKQADVLGCDSQCIDDCTNYEYVTYWELPQCIKWCPCEYGVIEITDGELDLHSLMQFSNKDKKAWSLFRKVQDKFF